ncbi:MAG: hypothetical protein DRQ13_06895 [Ignavibacteriae bacterium]|nr:MAG: hypothetical protein DRQ13_06895 [Ignavibacteriota bacterium]
MKLINLNGKNRVLIKIKDYLYLILSITIVSVFVLFLAPCIDDVPYVKPLTNFIDEREIDAGAIYYTDIEEFSVAEINMKNTMEYLPCFTPGAKSMKEKILIDD